MRKLINIKHYPSNFEVVYEEENETAVHSLSYDGLQGELTRKNWKEEDWFISGFVEEDQEKILDYMDIYQVFAEEDEEEEEE